MPAYIDPPPPQRNPGGSDQHPIHKENEQRIKYVLSTHSNAEEYRFSRWDDSIYASIDFCYEKSDGTYIAIEVRGRDNCYIGKGGPLVTWGKVAALMQAPLEAAAKGRLVKKAYYVWGSPKDSRTYILDLRPEKEDVWDYFKKTPPQRLKDTKTARGKFAEKDASGNTESGWYIPEHLLVCIVNPADEALPWRGQDDCFYEDWGSEVVEF